ncbi:multinuclear nonheme iron-dependent oxidase [Desulfocurvus sp. DL9XJH121]
MHARVATPFSHLFADPGAARAITAASDLLELRSPEQAREVRGDILFHCELSLAAPWGQAEAGLLREMARAARDRLRLVSFHLYSRYADNEVRDGAFVGRGAPMDEAVMLANAHANARTARELFGSATPLLVENNNHLGTDAYEVVTEPGFITEALDVAGAGLLLDVAHARISAANTGVGEAAYFVALPLERAGQIHLSAHGQDGGGRCFDAHEALSDKDFSYFVELLPVLPGLKFVSIEYYRDADILLEQIARLRSVLAGASKGEEA